MLLTNDDLFHLTKKRRYSAQANVLEAMAINFKTRPDGSLVVSKQHVEAVLGVKLNNSKITEPRWDLINAKKEIG